MTYTRFARTGFLVALAFVPLPAGTSGQSYSIKDEARRQGGKVSYSPDVEMPSASLSTVVSAADVIVRAHHKWGVGSHAG